MKNYLKVDDRNRQLIMDRLFDKNRRIVGSNEYELLQRARADYQGYALVLRHIKTNPEKRVYKHLTYEYTTIFSATLKIFVWWQNVFMPPSLLTRSAPKR